MIKKDLDFDKEFAVIANKDNKSISIMHMSDFKGQNIVVLFTSDYYDEVVEHLNMIKDKMNK